MKTRIKNLYKELEFIINNAPIISGCTTKENQMYSDMINLKNSIEDAGYVF